jgi:transglutaminase-like putative cysteine protease
MKRVKYIFLKVFPVVFPVLLLLWVLLVLYPNPVNLVVSIQRVVHPHTDPAAVASLANEMPDNPADIESAIRETFPYAYDWRAHGMPWYFPTVEEVLEKGQGDCKARALITASILEYKGIPYRLEFSPIHMWVEYEGKESNSLENSGALFYGLDPETGERSLQLPSISLRETARASWNGFWPPMPLIRKILLTTGVSLLVSGLVVTLWTRRASRVRGLGTASRPDSDKSIPGYSSDGSADDGRGMASTHRP